MPRRVIGMEHEVAAVYAASSRRLIGLLTVMGGSAADAEEIIQDAMVKLSRSGHGCGTTTTPRAGCAPSRCGADLEVSAPPGGVGRAVEAVRRRPHHGGPGLADSRVDLAAALATLPVSFAPLSPPPRSRPARRRGGHDLRVPAGTVKSRLSRARTALAPLVAEDIQPERSTP